jgi:hypothetical protein
LLDPELLDLLDLLDLPDLPDALDPDPAAADAPASVSSAVP